MTRIILSGKWKHINYFLEKTPKCLKYW